MKSNQKLYLIASTLLFACPSVQPSFYKQEEQPRNVIYPDGSVRDRLTGSIVFTKEQFETEKNASTMRTNEKILEKINNISGLIGGEEIGKAFNTPETQQAISKISQDLGNTLVDGLKDITRTFKESLQEGLRNSDKYAADMFHYAGNNPDKMIRFGLGIGCIAGGIYLVPKAIKITATLIEHKLLVKQPPSWIEYTTYKPLWKRTLVSLTRQKKETPKAIDAVLERNIGNQLDEFLCVTRGTLTAIALGNQHATFSNLMLLGPAGTGKTRVAEQLAAILDFDVIKVNSSVFTMKDVGVEAVNELFEFIENCGRPILLFIDEADALFASRDGLQSGSAQYAAINMFLQRLGTPNQKYIVVATTNYISNIDRAMSRRFQYQVKMDLPGEQARKQAFTYYYEQLFANNQHIYNETEQSARRVFSNAKLTKLAQQTNGLSYAHIETIMKIIAAKANAQEYDYLVTERLVDETVAAVLATLSNFDKE